MVSWTRGQPLYRARELEGAPGDGGDIFLSRLNNPDDVSKLVIFDTWISEC